MNNQLLEKLSPHLVKEYFFAQALVFFLGSTIIVQVPLLDTVFSKGLVGLIIILFSGYLILLAFRKSPKWLVVCTFFFLLIMVPITALFFSIDWIIHMKDTLINSPDKMYQTYVMVYTIGGLSLFFVSLISTILTIVQLIGFFDEAAKSLIENVKSVFEKIKQSKLIKSNNGGITILLVFFIIILSISYSQLWGLADTYKTFNNPDGMLEGILIASTAFLAITGTFLINKRINKNTIALSLINDFFYLFAFIVGLFTVVCTISTYIGWPKDITGNIDEFVLNNIRRVLRYFFGQIILFTVAFIVGIAEKYIVNRIKRNN